jgi:hypothetical protein
LDFRLDGRRARAGLAPRAPVAQLVLHHLALQRVAMDPEQLAGSRLFAAAPFQRAAIIRFSSSSIASSKKIVSIQKMFHQNIEFLFHYFLSASDAV